MSRRDTQRDTYRDSTRDPNPLYLQHKSAPLHFAEMAQMGLHFAPQVHSNDGSRRNPARRLPVNHRNLWRGVADNVSVYIAGDHRDGGGDMSIIRAPRPEADFVQIRNDVARDSRLSYKARGILIEVLSRPDNWEASADSLARGSREGRSAILSGLKELRAAGYVVIERDRLEDGRFVTRNVFFDTPQSGYPTAVDRTTVHRTTVHPTADNRTVLEHSPKNTDKEHLGKNKEERTADAALLAAAFDELWKHWPVRKRRADAVKALSEAVKRVDLQRLFDGASGYLNYLRTTDEYPQQLHKWLEGDRWEDEYPQPSSAPAVPPFDPNAPTCDHGAPVGCCALCRRAVA